MIYINAQFAAQIQTVDGQFLLATILSFFFFLEVYDSSCTISVWEEQNWGGSLCTDYSDNHGSAGSCIHLILSEIKFRLENSTNVLFFQMQQCFGTTTSLPELAEVILWIMFFQKIITFYKILRLPELASLELQDCCEHPESFSMGHWSNSCGSKYF